jgi:pimeloyl-ACP methyl ester carboxylesterase
VEIERRRYRVRWWWWLIVVVMVLVPAWALHALHKMVDGWQAAPMESVFAGHAMPVVHTVDLPTGRSILHGETGNPEGPLVIFIHGTPGGWGDFYSMLKNPLLTERAFVVSVDRVGWGGSEAGGLEPSLKEQAAAIAGVIRAHGGNRPTILVGHSLGGAIAPRVAIDFPDLVDGVVIVAGSIDPALEKTTWYQAVAFFPGIKQAIPKPLSRSNEEMRPLKRELEAMLPLWGGLRCPVIVLQGDLDELVPAANADFAERVITNAPLTVRRIPDLGHLIPWERPDLMVSAVVDLLDDRSTGGDD